MSPRPTLAPRVALLLALILLLPACGGWLRVNRVSSAQKKPNNAWVFFSVERLGDAPVTGLSADDFTIYEDGNPVTKEDTKQLLQSPDTAAAMYTLLLVDLSGTGAAAPPDALVDAVKAFADRVGKVHKVAIYAYDGDEKIHPIVPFADAKSAALNAPNAPNAPNALDAMRRFRTKDPSSNLHGAVVEGLRELHRSLERDHRSLRLGTLVVLPQGIDRANRVTREAMRTEWDDDKYKLDEVLAAGPDAPSLDAVGRDGTEAAAAGSTLADALDRVAARIEAHTQRYYLLSFCTSARKGDREVKVQAHGRNPDASGSLSYTFNADGLGPPPECDPRTPAAFDPKAAAAEEKAKDEGKPAAKRPQKGGAKPLLIDTPP